MRTKTATTTRKATHQGICQICGATQKLPSGVLSLHGYTTRWGFFSGICSGSGSLPFEQSKDLIEGAIQRAETDVQVTTAVSDGLKAGELREDGKAWHHVYSNRTGRSGWELVTVIAEQKSYKGLIPDGTYQESTWMEFRAVSDEAGRNRDRIDLYGRYKDVKTVDDMRRVLNRGYAESHLDIRCRDLRGYIQWQQERIANWKPQELKPISK